MAACMADAAAVEPHAHAVGTDPDGVSAFKKARDLGFREVVALRARDRAHPDAQEAAFGVTPRTGWARARGATAAVAALVVALSFGWITDFRSDNGRAGGTPWAPVAARWLADCQRDPDGSVTAPSSDPRLVVIPCANLRR